MEDYKELQQCEDGVMCYQPRGKEYCQVAVERLGQRPGMDSAPQLSEEPSHLALKLDWSIKNLETIHFCRLSLLPYGHFGKQPPGMNVLPSTVYVADFPLHTPAPSLLLCDGSHG